MDRERGRLVNKITSQKTSTSKILEKVVLERKHYLNIQVNMKKAHHEIKKKNIQKFIYGEEWDN